jgi:predicted RNA binding protein with dsRBD fold (UPF0201 family)
MGKVRGGSRTASEGFDADFAGGVPRRRRAATRHERRLLRQAQADAAPRPFAHVALEADVRLAAPLYPTEERAKVEAALSAIFPDAEFEPGEGAVRAKARDLTRIAEILRHSRIRDTARSKLQEARVSDTRLLFHLNKQAACAARVNFVGPGEILGAIEVDIACPDAGALAEEVTWIEGESDERLFGTKLHTLPPGRRRARRQG